MGYLLVTTIKNEENNLPRLFSSVENQTELPTIWYIINDGSTDNSKTLITQFKNKHPAFVYTYDIKEDARDITWKYHFLIKYGFEQAIEIAKQKSITWDCIGVLDGDIIIDQKEYFKTLRNYILNKAKIGTVSGCLYSYDNNIIIKEKRYSTHPTGAARLINRLALESIGGYPHIPSADAVILQKTRVRGFQNKIVSNLIVYQSRPTSSAEGIAIGLKKNAYSRYFLGHSLLFCFLYTLKLLVKKRSLIAFTFTKYFISLYLKNEPRTTDQEVLKYRKNYICNTLKEKYLHR